MGTSEPGTWAVIAGGGTGGHLYPGVAVAEALVERGHDPATLRFVGARRGVEAEHRALEELPGHPAARQGPRQALVAAELDRQFGGGRGFVRGRGDSGVLLFEVAAGGRYLAGRLCQFRLRGGCVDMAGPHRRRQRGRRCPASRTVWPRGRPSSRR